MKDDRLKDDIMGEIIVKYVPHPKQKIFHDNTSKYRAVITGVGFGKTACGINEMLRESIEHPGTMNLILAPTFPMVKNTTMREFQKFCPPELILEHNRSDHIITLATVPRTKIIYLSGDNETDIDRLRGLTIGCAYVDEISLVPYYLWEVLLARVRDPLGSGRIWGTATPKGRTWAVKLFVDKKEPKTENPLPNPGDYQVFTGSTLDNPYTPEAYKQALLNTYTGVFAKQEIYGQVVGFEGLVYPEFQRDLHVVRKLPEMKAYYLACDFGFTNPSVILLCGLDHDSRLYILEEFYETGVLPESYVQKACEYRSRFEITDCACDPSSPDYIASLNRVGIPATGVDSEIMAGILLVSQRLNKAGDGRPRLMVHERCVNTIMEFENYRYPENKEGKPVQEKPLKVMDHALDSVKYLCALINRRERGGFKVIGYID